MAYTKQNFEDGQVLKAEHLNTMEQGIVEATTYDTAPKSGSTKPVTSDGLNTKFEEQQEGIMMANMAATLAMPGSLKWDGVIGDREHIVLAPGETYNICLVHISEDYPSILSMGSEGLLNVALTSAEGYSDVMPVVYAVPEDGAIIDEGVFIIPSDNYSVADMGIAFPKKGIYVMAYHFAPVGFDMSLMYVSAISVPPYVFEDSAGGASGSEYFEGGSTTEVLGNTIIWDGDTTGRDTTTDTMESGNIWTFARVADITFTSDEFASRRHVVQVNGGEWGDTLAEVISETGDLLIGEVVLVVWQDNTSIEGWVFPRAGIYFLKTSGSEEFCATGLMSAAFTFAYTDYNAARKVIKTEHLPEHLQFGDAPKNTLLWSGNITGLEKIANPYYDTGVEYAYKVSDAVPTVDDCANGGSATVTIPHLYSQTRNFTNEDITPIEGGFHIFNGAALVITDSAVASPGVYLVYDDGAYISSFVINGYAGFTSVIPMDEKYLPMGAIETAIDAAIETAIGAAITASY